MHTQNSDEAYFVKKPETPTHQRALSSPQNSSATSLSSIYSTNPLYSHLNFNYKKLKALLSKSDRTFKDAHFIFEELTKFDFFKEYKEISPEMRDLLSRVCKTIKYKHFSRGSIIYRENEPSDGNIYFVLSGSVVIENRQSSLMTNNKVTTLIKRLSTVGQEGSQILGDNKALQRKPTINSPHVGSLDQEQLMIKLVESNNGSPQGTMPGLDRGMSKLLNFAETAEEVSKDLRKAGGHFGQSALGGASRRMDEAIAASHCEVILLPSEFLSQMKADYQDRAEAKYNFIVTHLPGLDEVVSFDVKNMLANLFTPVSVTRGHILTTEGEEGEKFFLVLEGQVEAYKRTKTEVESYHHFDSNFVRDRYRIDRHHNEDLCLFISRPGSFLGEEVVFQNYGKYEYTNKVVSAEAIVYEMDRAKFAFRFPENVFKLLFDLHMEKMKKNSEIFKEKLIFFAEEYNNLHSRKLLQERPFFSKPNTRNNSIMLNILPMQFPIMQFPSPPNSSRKKENNDLLSELKTPKLKNIPLLATPHLVKPIKTERPSYRENINDVNKLRYVFDERDLHEKIRQKILQAKQRRVLIPGKKHGHLTERTPENINKVISTNVLLRRANAPTEIYISDEEMLHAQQLITPLECKTARTSPRLPEITRPNLDFLPKLQPKTQRSSSKLEMKGRGGMTPFYVTGSSVLRNSEVKRPTKIKLMENFFVKD